MDTICDCCITPLRYILSQLIGQSVTIGLVANPPGQYTNAVIKAVGTGTVTITVANADHILSLCEVVGVRSPELANVSLLQPPTTPRTGECACCEAPIRQVFTANIGNTVDIVTVSGGNSFNNIQNALISATGEGIVLLDCTGTETSDCTVISLCKVQEISDIQTPS